jgi:predicted GTPase
MAYGAGVVAARQFAAAGQVDPRPYAVGSIQKTFERFPHLQGLLPAMGYSDAQCLELEDTINRTPCELVLVATPVDLAHLLRLNKPCLRVSYEIEERTQPGLGEILARFTQGFDAPRRRKTA